MILLPYVVGNQGGASGALAELGITGGLVLGAVVKWGLRLGWRCYTAKGKRPGAHRARC